MKIRYLNGLRLKRAILAGSHNVINNRSYLNKINVFPVADSDTGTNMAATLQSVMNELVTCVDHSVHGTIRVAADSALMGARGNSGVILAQFFHGLAEEMNTKLTVTTSYFGTAVNNAVDYAYQAMSNPREGTILTVIREWAGWVHQRAQKTEDFAELLRDSVEAAEVSLAKTPESLAVLKQAGVVDAGAQGFVDLLKGMVGFIKKGEIREIDRLSVVIQEELPTITEDMGEITFRYCTECLIEGSGIDQRALRSALSDMGDSLIVAGSDTKTKVHVHTNEPREVFRIGNTFGNVINEKADDMQGQFKDAHTQHGDIALITDTACDLPEALVDKYSIHQVPLKVLFGEKTYIDKLSLTPDEFYRLCREHPELHPTTSQPTPADFRNRFEFLGAHYKSILTFTLPAALSGTYQSAHTAANHTEAETEIHLIDSKLVSVGTGLVVRRVAEAIDAGADIDEAKALADALISRTRFFVTVPSLDSLIRGGRVSRMKGLVANLLNLKPIITLSSEGAAEQSGTVFGGVEHGKKKILKILRKHLDADRPADFAITHVDAMEDAHWFRERISAEFTTDREIFIQDATPVLAAHAGFGAVAVAFIAPPETA